MNSGGAAFRRILLDDAEHFMKNRIVVLAFAVIVSALVAGCGEKASKLSTESRLTATQLAELMDFHVWNVPIPQSLQPVKRARLVIVKADGTGRAEV